MSDKNDIPVDSSNKIKEFVEKIRVEEEIIKSIIDEKKNLVEKLALETQNLKEVEQENLLLKDINKTESLKTVSKNKRFYLTILIISIISMSALSTFIVYQNLEINKMLVTQTQFDTGYVIQNLKGDVVNTWVSWNILAERTLTIKIVNTAKVSPDKISAVKDAILSTESVSLDDSLLHKGPSGTSSVYYKGWVGALEQIPKNTVLYVPTKFSILESGAEGDIVLDLTSAINADGLSGYTDSLSDHSEILKSHITIYNVDNLSALQLSAIVRHEFGHAMGLAHSTAPEDLMHATIETDYPYISQCDIDAITALYDGSQSSQVVCTK